MTDLAAALLGIVQGLTEFLPISSSAHLILARAFFGWDAGALGLAFDVACHVGTLAAVLVYFRRELVAMARQAPAAVRGSGGADGHLLRLIAAGTVPILVVGLLFEQTIEERLRTPAIAAVALALGSVALVAADRWGGRSRREPSLTIRQAVAIGAAQAAALVPGVSRSGATMVVALLFGLERDAAARFSFLLGVPAILGAALREGAVVATSPMDPGVLWLFLIGAVTSYLTGYLTVKYFIRYIAGHGLAVFAYYRLGLALTVPIWLGWS